jgi:hypothetical protein
VAKSAGDGIDGTRKPAGGPLISTIVALGISQRRTRAGPARPRQVAPRRPRSLANVRPSSSSRSTGAVGKATSIRRTSWRNHRVRAPGRYPRTIRPRVTNSRSVHVPARNANANAFARWATIDTMDAESPTVLVLRGGTARYWPGHRAVIWLSSQVPLGFPQRDGMSRRLGDSAPSNPG